MVRFRNLTVLCAMGVISGCSPYAYNKEISAFSAGVSTVTSAYQTGQQAIDTIVVQQRQAAEVNGRTRLKLLPGCDQNQPSGTPPILPDCAIVPFGTDSTPPPNSIQKNLTDAAPAFNALKTYAASLAAVTAAADDAALDRATQNLTTATKGLAATVAKLAPSATSASSLVTPIGTLVGQGLTIYLDQRRYAVLSTTVPAVDDCVRVLGQTVQAALLDIRAQQLVQLGAQLRSEAEPFEETSVSKLSENDYQTKLDILELKVSAFSQARAADPTTTVATMVNAHHQLMLALEANTGQGTAVLTAVESFASAAENLKTATETAAAVTTKK